MSGGGAPDFLSNLVDGYDAPGVPHKVIEQGELGWRKADVVVGQSHRMLAAVKGQSAHLDFVGLLADRISLHPAKERVDPGHELLIAERLGHEIVGPEPESPNDVLLGRVGAEN